MLMRLSDPEVNQIPVQLGEVTEPADVAALTSEVSQLRSALESRDVIGQAKGIVRFLTQTDGENAFVLLSMLSQDTNRKLREVAVIVTECAATGQSLPADLGASWRKHTAK